MSAVSILCDCYHFWHDLKLFVPSSFLPSFPNTVEQAAAVAATAATAAAAAACSHRRRQLSSTRLHRQTGRIRKPTQRQSEMGFWSAPF
jgi:hypothetical protein